jgi:hypothetical protein
MTHKNHDLLLWAHSLLEYQKMFDLNEHDLNKKILDCPAGFSSFNTELTAQDKLVTSCDKIYDFSTAHMLTHIEQVLRDMYQEVKAVDAANPQRFIWQNNNSPEKLLEKRTQQAQLFLQERYIVGKLPKLPFTDNQFELALCSHFLFASSDLTFEFHVKAILEMCRVAGEVRIFPLLNAVGEVSPIAAPMVIGIQAYDMGVEIRQVNYEFQRGGNAMLRIWNQTCQV